MKRLLLPLIITAASTTALLGDPAYDAETVRILQKTPTFSKEEVQQMLFSASFAGRGYTPGTLQYALYNPSREKVIQGIVITIRSKDASSGQEQSVDLFIDANCGPLQCVGNQEIPSVLAEIEKKSPTLTLKEVHYYTPQP